MNECTVWMVGWGREGFLRSTPEPTHCWLSASWSTMMACQTGCVQHTDRLIAQSVHLPPFRINLFPCFCRFCRLKLCSHQTLTKRLCISRNSVYNTHIPTNTKGNMSCPLDVSDLPFLRTHAGLWSDRGLISGY